MVYQDIKTMDFLSSDLDIIKVALKEYTCSSFKNYNFSKELNFSWDKYNALKNLSSSKNIIIQKSDKGNSAVLMNRDDHINLMETLISDAAKSQKLSVPEDNSYNFMVQEKKLVDNVLYPVYERIPLLVILKQYSLLMRQALHVCMAYQKFIKR